MWEREVVSALDSLVIKKLNMFGKMWLQYAWFGVFIKIKKNNLKVIKMWIIRFWQSACHMADTQYNMVETTCWSLNWASESGWKVV